MALKQFGARRTYPVPDFQVGDKVAYSVQFLRNIGEGPTSRMHRARGRILELEAFGDSKLARMDWGPEFPERVNVFNLAKVGPNPRFANVD